MNEKKKWPWRKRIIFLLVTLVIIFAVAECGLRLVGASLRPDIADSNQDLDECEAITFLTVGDSMTYGLGADRHQAYPVQMIEFFEKAYPGIRAKSYNLGLPGSNSSEAIGRIRGFFKTHNNSQADFAFVLLGVNNRWNLHNAAFWDWKDDRREHYAQFVASQFQLKKAVSVAAQGGQEAAAKSVSNEQYRSHLEQTSWDVFFKSFDDDLLSRWIKSDLKTIDGFFREHDILPIYLTYFSPRFERLNPLLKQTANEIDAILIDMEKPAQYYDLRNLFAQDHFHMNNKGYRDVAKRLMAEFTKQFSKEDLEKLLKKKSCTRR